MNPYLQYLQSYPFEKLKKLITTLTANAELKAISLAIGEPKHPTPDIIKNAQINHLEKLANYPTTKGSLELREACTNWLKKRFNLHDHISSEDNLLPVNGTREALFSLAQCVIDPTQKPIVLIPNPFYQIYEGAALLAGAEPFYYDCSVINGEIPSLNEVSEDIWKRCQLIYICTPGNPTGELAPKETLQQLIEYSLKYDFVIASDECYSEIYKPDRSPPLGLLHYAQELGNTTFKNCIAFYSLSKRSNAPGLRSGFVAGEKKLIENFLHYRTYHGCAMSLPTQSASIEAWNDETHVKTNRELYEEKFQAVLEILDSVMPCEKPPAGFYLWPEIPEKYQMDEITFCRLLYTEQNVLCLPGSYLAREVDGYNPGQKRVRLALVAQLDECVEAAQRIRALLQ